MTSSNSRLQPSTCGRGRPPGRPGRPRRRRSRGSAARSSCRARRPRSWPRRAASGRGPPPCAAATCSAPNSEFDDVSEPVTATPSQPMIGERNGEDAARAGDPLAEREGLAGEVHHVGQREHGGDGQRRPLELRRASRRRRAAPAPGVTRSTSIVSRPETSSSVPAALAQLNLKVTALGASPSALRTFRPGQSNAFVEPVEEVLDRPPLGEREDRDDDQVRRVGGEDRRRAAVAAVAVACAGPRAS